MHKWFRNAIFYSLDVETFLDSNDDGVGDFPGLISKLDYLSGLGVTCIWLLPFFPSPNRDNGYDVEDYYNVDHRLGDLGDFVHFVSRCHDLGMRVIIDLVINHTSHRHPWFQAARKDPDSPFREFYVWSDKPRKFRHEDIFFSDEESTMWSYDKVAGQYYLHRFYKEQPDLNIASPKLRAEIVKIIGFWLALGVDGFRVDATEVLIEPYGMHGVRNLEHVLEEIRSFVQSKKPDAILVAETNILPKKIPIYFKGNDRMHMLFAFFVNQHIFLAVARKNARALSRACERLPECSPAQQWLQFLRHHDELSLQLLSDRDAAVIFERFAPEQRMRIFRRGIRRRLAPMANNDPRLIRMFYSLLFSLPGTPLLRYGDEIGMGEDLSLHGRNSVRTPMQWSPAKNGGFSRARPGKIVHPVISDGAFSDKHVNVLSQQRDPASLLNFVERLITTRKQTPEIGEGKFTFLKGFPKSVLVHRCEFGNVTMLFIHNLSDELFTLPVSQIVKDARPVFEAFCDEESFLDESILILRGYGFTWLRIEDETK